MRKDQQYHYFSTDEVRLIQSIADDIKVTVECNKLNQIPHIRANEWVYYLSILLDKRRKDKK